MPLWLRFTIAVLATWRVAHLVAHEDGPGDIVARFRQRITHPGLNAMLRCVYCSSLWIAAPAALWLTTAPLDWLLTMLAISGAASIVERSGHEPVVIRELRAPTSHEEGI